MRNHIPQIALSIMTAVLMLGVVSYFSASSSSSALTAYAGIAGLNAQYSIMLVVLVVAMVGGVGFWFWKRRKETSTAQPISISTDSGAENPQLTRLRVFVDKELSNGQSIPDIKNSLLRVGWDKNTVDAALKG